MILEFISTVFSVITLGIIVGGVFIVYMAVLAIYTFLHVIDKFFQLKGDIEMKEIRDRKALIHNQIVSYDMCTTNKLLVVDKSIFGNAVEHPCTLRTILTMPVKKMNQNQAG